MGEGQPGSLCSGPSPILPSLACQLHLPLLPLSPRAHTLNCSESLLCLCSRMSIHLGTPVILSPSSDFARLFARIHPSDFSSGIPSSGIPAQTPPPAHPLLLGGTLCLSPCWHSPHDMSRSCLLLALSQVSEPHQSRALSSSSLTPWSLAQHPARHRSLIKMCLEMS